MQYAVVFLLEHFAILREETKNVVSSQVFVGHKDSCTSLTDLPCFRCYFLFTSVHASGGTLNSGLLAEASIAEEERYIVVVFRRRPSYPPKMYFFLFVHLLLGK